ncbi:hypothetical protein FALCPG4_011438 [Fusarium falciforme]
MLGRATSTLTASLALSRVVVTPSPFPSIAGAPTGSLSVPTASSPARLVPRRAYPASQSARRAPAVLLPLPSLRSPSALQAPPLVQKLQVLSYNMWHGGTQVNNYHEKQVRFLAMSGADIVGLQEDQSGRHAPRLASALGWHYWTSGGDVGILSKYPIVEEYGVIITPSRSGGARIALDGEDQQVNFYVAHLGHDPYGPYDFCFDNMTVERVLEREAQSGRTSQITDTLAAMEEHLTQADQVPTLLVGGY